MKADFNTIKVGIRAIIKELLMSCSYQNHVKQIAEKRFQELGASKILLSPSDYYWELQGEFYKVTVLSDFWTIEWTNNRLYASNQCFEDVDPMQYDLTEQQIIVYINSLLPSAKKFSLPG